ncbi:MAG: hypothetical protein ACE15F_08850 [bacterium]
MRKDLLAVALAGAVILLFGREILLEHASPFRGDIPVQFYPWKEYTRDMLASGEIPYWNPYAYGGAPFLANMQSAVFYPLDLALFVFPQEWFFGLSLLLHWLVAALGAFWLARICGAGSFPAALAALAYSLNGFNMIHIPAGNHLTYAGAAWAPWMFGSVAGFVLTRGSRLPWALATAGIVTLHFLCGHPQMMFYSLVFSFLFCLILGIFVERTREQPNPVVPMLRTGAWSMFTLLGLALAGMQLVPTLQYLGEANRAAGLDLAMATEFSFAPHRLITLFCPEYYGTFIAGNHYDSFVYWSCAYAGVIVPVLAAVAFTARKRFPAVIPLMIVGGLGLFLAWGRGNPVYAALFQLPGFGHFRAPAKFLPYYLVPVCVLAALAVEWISGRAFDEQQAPKEATPHYFYIFSLAVMAVLFLAYGIPALARLTELLHQTDGSEPKGIRSYAIARSGLIAVAGLAACLLARRIPRYPRLAVSLALTMVLAVDLISYGRPYLLASLRRPDAIRKSIAPPQEIGWIRSQTQGRPERVATLAEIGYPNLLMLWKTSNLAGYDPLSLRSYNRLVGAMEGWEEGAFHDNIQLRKTDGSALDLLNVRYILTLQSLTGSGLKQAFAGNDFQVYERQSEKRAWASLRAPDDPASAEETWKPVDSEIEIHRYSPHEIVFHFTSEKPVDLRVAEWHYPGWRAEARLKDGQRIPVTMEPSPEGLRVLRLPADGSQVRMFYRAPWRGWIVSAAAAVLFTLLAVWVLITRTDRHLAWLQRVMGRYY